MATRLPDDAFTPLLPETDVLSGSEEDQLVVHTEMKPRRASRRKEVYWYHSVGDFFNCLKAFIGTNYQALPFAFHNSGLALGVLGVLCIAALTDHCVQLLLRCKSVVIARVSEQRVASGEMVTAERAQLERRLQQTVSYGDVGKEALGPWCAHLIQFSVWFTQFMTVMSYYIFIGNTVYEIFPTYPVPYVIQNGTHPHLMGSPVKHHRHGVPMLHIHNIDPAGDTWDNSSHMTPLSRARRDVDNLMVDFDEAWTQLSQQPSGSDEESSASYVTWSEHKQRVPGTEAMKLQTAVNNDVMMAESRKNTQLSTPNVHKLENRQTFQADLTTAAIRSDETITKAALQEIRENALTVGRRATLPVSNDPITKQKNIGTTSSLPKITPQQGATTPVAMVTSSPTTVQQVTTTTTTTATKTTNRPSTGAPVTNSTTEVPATNSTTEVPATNSTTDAPVTNSTTVAPVTNSTTVSPVTNTTTPLPPEPVDPAFFHRSSAPDLRLVILFPLPFFLLTSLIRKVRWMAPFSSIATVALAGGAFSVLGFIVANFQISDFEWYKFKTLPLFLGQLISAYEGIGCVIPIQSSMDGNRHLFPGFVHGAVTIVFFILCSFGVLGYVTYGDAVEQIIVLNIPQHSVLAVMVDVTLIISVLFTYPLQCFPVIDILELYIFSPGKCCGPRVPAGPQYQAVSQDSRVYGTNADINDDDTAERDMEKSVEASAGEVAVIVPDTVLAWKRNVLRTVLTLVLVGIAILLKDAYAYTGAVTGALGASLLAFILPCAIHLSLLYDELSMATVVKDVAIIVIAVVTSVMTVISIIIKAVSTFRH